MRVRLLPALIVLLPVVLAVVLAGCTAAPATPAPTAAGTPDTGTSVTVDGRTAAVHRGTTRPGAPVVVVLHGAGGNGASMRDSTGWDTLADRVGLVVAYPDGLNGTWNAGTCCGRSAANRVDDVTYLHDLAAALGTGGPTYAVGFSNGAMMTYTWACARPGELAGIGAVAGALVTPCAAPAPLRIAAVAGSDDRNVPAAGRPERGWPGLDATLAPFLAAGSCTAPGTTTAGRATLTTWTCAQGTVHRSDLAGQGHSWSAPGSGPGTTTEPDDDTGWIWSVLTA